MCSGIKQKGVMYRELRHWVDKFGFFQQYLTVCGQGHLWRLAEEEWNKRRKLAAGIGNPMPLMREEAEESEGKEEDG